MDASRTGAQKIKMTKEQAIELAMSKSLGSAAMSGNIHL
jgi:hypothetical protein